MQKKVDSLPGRLVFILVLALLPTLGACQGLAANDPSPSATPFEIPSPTTTPVNFAPAETAQTPPTPEPTPSPFPQSLPDLARSVYGDRLIQYIRIPVLSIYAPVTPVGWSAQDPYTPAGSGWDSPDAQVGWVVASSLPDDPLGKIILYGHNNIDSSVFKYLYQLVPGDEIRLETGQAQWSYVTERVEITPVEEGDASELFDPATSAEGLSLIIISCYPPDNNTQRVIVTAKPK